MAVIEAFRPPDEAAYMKAKERDSKRLRSADFCHTGKTQHP
jgi:hypothetical protein